MLELWQLPWALGSHSCSSALCSSSLAGPERHREPREPLGLRDSSQNHPADRGHPPGELKVRDHRGLSSHAYPLPHSVPAKHMPVSPHNSVLRQSFRIKIIARSRPARESCKCGHGGAAPVVQEGTTGASHGVYYRIIDFQAGRDLGA